MNYFDFFEIPVSFILDEGLLKKKFYQNSKAWHPDFYTLQSEEKQAENLQLSTINNQAYKTLFDFHKRMFHVLELNGMIENEGETKLPQAFLAEMMEINEELMELQFGFDKQKYDEIVSQISKHKEKMLQAINADLEAYDDNSPDKEALKRIKDYYFKNRYLLRLKENLDGVVK